MKLHMGIIKLEINIAEIKSALEEIKFNRLKIFDNLANEVKSAFKTSIEELLNSEITIFLGNSEELDNKKNGYALREYVFKGIGAISLKVPRDRNGKFSSSIIPKHEQIDPRVKEDIAVLHLAGLSTRTLSLLSNRLLGASVSPDTVSKSLGAISDKALKWLERPIEQNYWALYIDGTYFKVKRKDGVEREPNLIVVGIDDKNRKSILAIEHGFKENIDSWRSVFEGLQKRGLNTSHVKIGIMDGLPGLEGLFKDIFINAVTARCWSHSLRNALLKTPKRYQDKFKKDLYSVMYASDATTGRDCFKVLKNTYESECQRAVACIEKDLDSLLVHLQFDPEFHISLKTTNPIERVNKEFKRRTKTMETVGEATLRCILAFTALRLELGWMSKSAKIPGFKSLHDFNQKRMNQIEDAIDKLLH